MLGGVKRCLLPSEKYAIELSRDETAVLKAIAIIMVVFHNYWHNIFGAPGENEQYFRSWVIGKVWNALADNPVDFIHPLSSFFGHYGVHVFIFLSGYGLTRKLISTLNIDENKTWGLIYIYREIVFGQIVKILKLIIIGLIFLCLIRGCQTGNFSFLNKGFLRDLLAFCTFTQNFRPDQLYAFCTVWWFLPLIMQLYIFFPFIVRIVKKYPEKSMLVFLVLTALCGIASKTLENHFHIYIFSTPFAQALVFAFGVYCGMGFKAPKMIFLLAFIVFPLSWRFRFFFPFGFISVVLIAVYLMQKFKTVLNVPWLVCIGHLSMFIYITHGDIRWPLLQAVNQSQDLFVAYVMFLGYVVLCLAVAWLCRATARSLHLLK